MGDEDSNGAPYASPATTACEPNLTSALTPRRRGLLPVSPRRDQVLRAPTLADHSPARPPAATTTRTSSALFRRARTRRTRMRIAVRALQNPLLGHAPACLLTLLTICALPSSRSALGGGLLSASPDAAPCPFSLCASPRPRRPSVQQLATGCPACPVLTSGGRRGLMGLQGRRACGGALGAFCPSFSRAAHHPVCCTRFMTALRSRDLPALPEHASCEPVRRDASAAAGARTPVVVPARRRVLPTRPARRPGQAGSLASLPPSPSPGRLHQQQAILRPSRRQALVVSPASSFDASAGPPSRGSPPRHSTSSSSVVLQLGPASPSRCHPRPCTSPRPRQARQARARPRLPPQMPSFPLNPIARPSRAPTPAEVYDCLAQLLPPVASPPPLDLLPMVMPLLAVLRLWNVHLRSEARRALELVPEQDKKVRKRLKALSKDKTQDALEQKLHGFGTMVGLWVRALSCLASRPSPRAEADPHLARALPSARHSASRRPSSPARRPRPSCSP